MGDKTINVAINERVITIHEGHGGDDGEAIKIAIDTFKNNNKISREKIIKIMGVTDEEKNAMLDQASDTIFGIRVYAQEMIIKREEE